MAKEFTYFAGTLPMLFFGEKSPMTVAAFDEDADRLLDAKSASLLKSAELYCAAAEKFPLPVQKFYDWENALRNTLLDFRKKYSPDAADYKRNNPDFYSEIAPVLAQAGNTADLLEEEKMIDKLRWNALDNFGAGHYSDMTALVFYRIRLQILAKYLTRTAEAGNQALENILSGLIDSSNTN